VRCCISGRGAVSIPVPLADLAAAVSARSFGYLITVNADATPKVLALVPTWIEGRLRFSAGAGGTARNALERPQVSVVFPPGDTDAFTLVVDGTASVLGEIIEVLPTWAVRHRPAP